MESLGKAALAAVVIILLVRVIRRREGMENKMVTPLSIAKPTIASDPIAFFRSMFTPETPTYSVGDRGPDPQCALIRSLTQGSGLFPFLPSI